MTASQEPPLIVGRCPWSFIKRRANRFRYCWTAGTYRAQITKGIFLIDFLSLAS